MQITFLRHATAEDRSLGTPDADRALTDKGRKQVKRVAAFCLNNRLIPDNLFSSPLLRALQTATIFQEQLSACPKPKTVPWLGMDTSAQIIINELSNLAEQGLNDIWLVGHEPDFSSTIGLLLHTDSDNIVIKKASITQLEANFNGSPAAKLLYSIPCALMP